MRPANITTQGAQNYYHEKDPLFNADRKQHNTAWHGKGAAQLSLEGQVQAQDFKAVIEGKDPRTGEVLVKPSLSNLEHRAGIDIPLSSPKSVSHAALVAKDERLVRAHDNAVRVTIESLQSDYSFTRDQRNGQCIQKLQGNLCVATFRHSLSRENDPQLHSHTFISNIVQTPNGPRALSNEAIFQDQKYITRVYQSELAKNVKELGYGIETRSNGTWEIAGYRQEVLVQFSKRTIQVHKSEAALKEARDKGELYTNSSDGALNKIAARDSRQAKDNAMTLERFDTSMREQHDKLGIAIEEQQAEVMQAADSGRATEREEIKLSEYETVRLAVEQLQKTESTFTKQEAIGQAIKNSYGEYNARDLNRAFDELAKDKELNQIGQDAHDRRNTKMIYSTPRMIRNEKEIINNIEAGKNRSNVFFPRDDVFQFIKSREQQISTENKNPFSYTVDQKNATAAILCSKDLTIVIQGDAGVGKTASVALVKEYAEQHGCTVRGFSFTGKAVSEMVHVGINNSQTISSYLEQKRHHISAKQEIWVIDEASMIGSRDGHKMLQAAQKTRAKVVLIGDRVQKDSISAGRMFQEVQDRSTTTQYNMCEAKRFLTEQQNETVTYLKAAAQEIRKGEHTNVKQHTDRAINRIEQAGHFYELKDREERQAVAVKQYFYYSEDGKSALVLTKTNAERQEINKQIRRERIAKGEIGQGFLCTVRTPVSIQADRATIADTYKPGQSILARENFAGLKRGEKAEVMTVDRNKNTLTVTGKDGKERMVDLKTVYEKFSTYNIEQKEFAQGDKVTFLENDRKLNVKNGQTAEIKNIDDQGNMTVQLHGRNKEISLNVNEGHAKRNCGFYNYSKIDYSYSVTLEKSQGGTVDNAIYVADSNSRGVDFKDFYVATTRARDNVIVITDSREHFAEKVSHDHEKTSTLDHSIDEIAKGVDVEIKKDDSEKAWEARPDAAQREEHCKEYAGPGQDGKGADSEQGESHSQEGKQSENEGKYESQHEQAREQEMSL